MPLPTQPPGGGGERGYTHFHHTRTEFGSKWEAYIAGPCMWFFCHASKRSKPCLRILCGECVPCPKCGSPKPVDLLGYQPLYRAVDGKPVFIVLHEDAREEVDKLGFLTRVLVGREREQSDGVWMKKAMSQQPAYHSTLPERGREADLTESLLRVWGIPELVSWYRSTNGKANTPYSPDTKKDVRVSAHDGKPVDPLMQAAARRYGLPQGTEDAEESYGKVLDKLNQKAGKNGTSSNGKNGRHD